MPELTTPPGDLTDDGLDPAAATSGDTGAAAAAPTTATGPTPPPGEYPANMLGASAIVLGVVGVFFVWTFGVANLLAVGLGIGSLVRSRRRGQTGGAGIDAIGLGIVGLGVTAFVIMRLVSGE